MISLQIRKLGVGVLNSRSVLSNLRQYSSKIWTSGTLPEHDPLGENSPIKKFLEKNKAGGIHHVCIEVDDVKATMKELKEQKKEETKIGAHGKPVLVFLHPKYCAGVLVELEQS